MTYTFRHKLGAILYDLPRFAWAMRPAKSNSSVAAPWVYFCNRNERLIKEPGEKGVACDWRWTSDLHIAKMFPPLSLHLLRRALYDWPITLRSEPIQSTKNVEVTFIIGHRGLARLPHLLLTLQSIAAQCEVGFECIVVEQAITPEIQSLLPNWVRYIHTPPPHSKMPYCRSWAFNIGAREASGKILVLHDNDMLVPDKYASEIRRRFREGFEISNLKRFIFYLSERHSARIFASGQLQVDSPPEIVVQNLEAGGSLAVSKNAYFALGGFDESFVGWGGEDNEFWERAQTRKYWSYGYLPILHVWHSPQPGKHLGEAALAKQRYWQLARIEPETRIKLLTQLSTGQKEGPIRNEYTPTQ